MSPEAVDYMAIAEYHLNRSERAALAELYEDAARNAYLAAMNAARAVIFEKTGTAPKSHSGTHSQFNRLIHEGLPLPREHAVFLAKGFETKQSVDYGPLHFVMREEAEDFLLRARAFIAAAKAVCA